MHTSLSKNLNIPAPLVPLFIAATAIGTAASVAGLGLQGAQHHEFMRQLPEQKRFLEVQLKLAQHQLKQYEDEKQAREKDQKVREEMLKIPSNIHIAKNASPLGSLNRIPNVSGVMTRSMTRNSIIPKITDQPSTSSFGLTKQYQGFANPAFDAKNYGGSSERIHVHQPNRIINSSNQINLNMSTMARSPSTVKLRASDQSLGGNLKKIESPFTNFRRRPIHNDSIQLNDMSPLTRIRGHRLSPNMRMRINDGKITYERMPADMLRPPTAASLFQHVAARMRHRLRHNNYVAGFRPTLRRRIQNFMNRHKRKLAIAGGVLAGGGAFIGGLIGGLSEKEEQMREGHNGTLARLIKASPNESVGNLYNSSAESSYNIGGGGGGGGFYSKQVTRRQKPNKQTSKKQTSKKQTAKKRTSKKQKTVKKVKRLAKPTKTVTGINKKQTCKKKQFAAF